MNYLYLEFPISYFQAPVGCKYLKLWKVKLQIRLPVSHLRHHFPRAGGCRRQHRKGPPGQGVPREAWGWPGRGQPKDRGSRTRSHVVLDTAFPPAECASSAFNFFFKKIYSHLFILRELQGSGEWGERGKYKEIFHHSLTPRWLQQPALRQAEARIRGPHPGLPDG